MRLWLISAALVLSSAHAALVISDVDDTIKITNSGSLVDAAWSGVFKKEVFPGMPELYRAWGKQHKIYFVTGSPTIIRDRIQDLLREHKVRYERLVTRSNILERTYSYKLHAISRIMEAQPTEQVVLVGDDVSADHEVFKALDEKFPGRVLVSYVRPVRNRPALAGQVPYVTAYDINTTELAAGRIGLVDYGVITAAVMVGAPEKLLPPFAWCPTELDGTLLPTESSSHLGAQQVEDRVEEICRGRGARRHHDKVVSNPLETIQD